MIIAVDGPAAAGKGTLARRLAAELGLPYLDTGLLYRATGRLVLDAGADPADPAAAEAAALRLRAEDLERTDLRGPAQDDAASKVAAIPAVRAALLAFQRRFGKERGAVLDGRDIGTVVFPQADVKLFVTASVERQREQRHAERGGQVPLAQVAAEMAARGLSVEVLSADHQNKAADAVLLDTTELDAEAAFQAALGIIRPKVKLSA